MIYLLILVLVVLFLAVFAFITWRIMVSQAQEGQGADGEYVCPECNEHHCDCHKKS